MKIAIEYINWLQHERSKINAVPLEQIEFYEKGMLLDVRKLADQFGIIGLNNTDFISTNFYKKGWDKKE